MSRAEVVRRLLDEALSGSASSLDDDLAAIEASFGVVAEAEPPERGPDERAAHVDRMWRPDP